VTCDGIVSGRTVVTDEREMTVDVTLDTADSTEWSLVFAIPQ
jgi:hypothetical protein